MSKKSKLMKNTVIIALGNICTKCISFFMLPLYTSILSTEEYGNVDLVSTYAALLMIIMTLQFEQGVFRFLIDSRNDKERQKRYITTSLIAVVIVNIIFVVLLLPILLFIKYQYTLYLISWVVFGSFSCIVLQIPRGLGDNTTYAIGSFISGASQVVLNVLFIAGLRYGANGMLMATVLSLIFTVIYVSIKLKIWKYINVSWIDKRVLKELVKYSFPLIPYTMCWWIINASDRTIISFMLGTAFNGVYAAAYKFPSMFSMITNIFQLSWTESASENVNDNNRDTYYQDIINSATRFYSSCNIGIIAIMPFLFDILIKNDFKEAYYIIPILMTAALFHSISALYGSIYFALKETKKVLGTTILAAIINIAVNIIFINSIGLYAAALSSLVAYIVITLIRYFDVQKIFNIKISIKYILLEIFVYCLIIFGYYSNIRLVQIIFLVLLVPYCCVQNKKTIKGICVSCLKKIKNKGV